MFYCVCLYLFLCLCLPYYAQPSQPPISPYSFQLVEWEIHIIKELLNARSDFDVIGSLDDHDDGSLGEFNHARVISYSLIPFFTVE